jgi:predicted dehydrogenase
MGFRVGVAGLRRGWAVASVTAVFDEMEIVAACDLEPALLERARTELGVEEGYEDYDAFLSHDMDAVVVATPPGLHAEHSVKALGAGHHVLCEVPMIYGGDADEVMGQARSLVAAVEASDSVFMFAENSNYWWFVGDWRDRIAHGDVGDLTYVEAEYVHDCRSIMRYPDGRLTWRASMAPLYYCTHSLGPVLEWTGDRIVSAIGAQTTRTCDPELPGADLEIGLFTTESGVLIKLLCGFQVARAPSHHYFSLFGTEGCLETSRESAGARGQVKGAESATLGGIPFSYDHPSAPDGATVGGHGTAEYYMVADFLRAIRGETAPAIDVYAGLDMTLPGVFAHHSATHGGEKIAVPDLRADASA